MPWKDPDGYRPPRIVRRHIWYDRMLAVFVILTFAMAAWGVVYLVIHVLRRIFG